MRMLISFIAALGLSLPGSSGLASLAAPLTISAIAAAPAALVLLGTGEAKAKARRAGRPRGGHRAAVRSSGRHTVNRRVHGAASRPYPGRPGYRPGRPGYQPGRPGYRPGRPGQPGRPYARPPYYGHYARRDLYYRPGYHGYYGYGAGVAAGVATSLAIGTVVASLPRGCTSSTVNGVYYQHCGNTWYAPQYSGEEVTYAVVAPPR